MPFVCFLLTRGHYVYLVLCNIFTPKFLTFLFCNSKCLRHRCLCVNVLLPKRFFLDRFKGIIFVVYIFIYLLRFTKIWYIIAYSLGCSAQLGWEHTNFYRISRNTFLWFQHFKSTLADMNAKNINIYVSLTVHACIYVHTCVFYLSR